MYRRLLIIVALICSGIAVAQVSDSYVIQYVEEGQKAGKTGEQLVKELFTENIVVKPAVSSLNEIISSTEDDILKIVVLNRYVPVNRFNVYIFNFKRFRMKIVSDFNFRSV